MEERIKDNMPENGRFDAEKANRLRHQAMKAFRGRMKRVDRVFYIWLVVFLLGVVYSLGQFVRSADTHGQMLWAVAFLMFFETTILIKLWYWIVNNKIGLLKEVKMLRMDLAIQNGSATEMVEIDDGRSIIRTPGVSRMERWVWLLLVVAIAMFGFGIELGQRPDLMFGFSIGSIQRPNLVPLSTDGALCVLETSDGAGQFTKSFTTIRTIAGFEVEVRGDGRSYKALSLAGKDTPYYQSGGAFSNPRMRFSCGRDIPPGTYTITIDQNSESKGSVVIVAEKQ